MNMESMEKWREAFRDAANALGFKGVELDESASCTIRSERAGVPPIYLVYDERNDLVDILAEIGHVPDDDQGLYREFLFDNLYGDRTKGAVFAASRESGRIVLQRTLEVATLAGGEALAAVLVDFTEVACGARRRLFRSVLPEAEEPAAAKPVGDMGIRV